MRATRLRSPDSVRMSSGSSKSVFLHIFFLLIGIAGLHDGMKLAFASPDPEGSYSIRSPQDSRPPLSTCLERADSHWSGRLKVIGSLSWADESTFFKPVGMGHFYDGHADLRLMDETSFSNWGSFEVHYEAILSGGDSFRKRKELESFSPKSPEEVFLIRSPLNDDRRLMDLTRTVREQDGYILFHRLDRLSLMLQPRWGNIVIGRQALTWGNGLIFNPMDLFNPFAPTDIERDYKVGDDMITAQFPVPSIGDFQFLYVARRNPKTENVESDEASFAGKLHFAVGTTEFDFMGTKHYDDYIVGMGLTGYFGDAAWRLDATWTVLDHADEMGRSDFLSLVGNMDYSWTWWGKNFYGLIEYYHNGLGEDDPQEALLNPDITDRLERGELFVLGRNYVSGEIQVELHPLFNIFLTLINNIDGPSGIIQPRAVWDITENLQTKFGANFFYGSQGTEFGGFVIPGTDIRSRSPNSAFVWFNYYF